MVRFDCVIAGSGDSRTMLPLAVKLMVQGVVQPPELCVSIASRREPGPLSFTFVTTMLAGGATTSNRALSPGSRLSPEDDCACSWTFVSTVSYVLPLTV